LVFTPVDVSDITVDSISTGVDAFKADGDGLYDILIDIKSGPPAVRLTAGETAVWDLSGIAGLDALDFDFLSAPDGGHGPFKAAAHVQGIGPQNADSGWVAPETTTTTTTVTPTTTITPTTGGVPEPSMLLLLGSGLALASKRLRRQKI
jgi:hypothetical protein